MKFGTAVKFLLPAFLLASQGTGAADAPLPYVLDKSIPLGQGERWDYVTYDSHDNRAYVAHGDHVTVVDLSKGAVIGDVGPFPGGTHGIVVAHVSDHGYTDDGKAGLVGVFDPSTLKVTRTVPAAPDADGILFDKSSGHVFVIEGDSGSVGVIDPKTDSTITTIMVGAGLEAGALDGMGHFYVDGADQHDIVEIDTATNKIMAHFPMAGCERPHGVAVDAESRRVFATCSNKVMVGLDADSGKVIGTVPIGGYNDGAAFDPVRKRVFASNGDGTLTVVSDKDPNTLVVLANVPTEPSARTIAIDEATGRLLLPAADIAKIDMPTTPGGRPHVTFVPGSLKLLVYKPTD